MTTETRINNFLTRKFESYPELKQDVNTLLNTSFRD